MGTAEAENGDALAITCKYCGNLSRFKLKELIGDEPLTCSACGEPLEGRRKEEKVKRASELLTKDPVWGVYWRERRTDFVERVAMAIALIIVAGFLALCAVMFIAEYSGN